MPVPRVMGVTVAVKVTGWPSWLGSAEDDSVVAGSTICPPGRLPVVLPG